MGFDAVLKDMVSARGFDEREQNSSRHATESVPQPQPHKESGTFSPPALKPVPVVRQTSLPNPPEMAHSPRRASETDYLTQTRRNVVGEFER